MSSVGNNTAADNDGINTATQNSLVGDKSRRTKCRNSNVKFEKTDIDKKEKQENDGCDEEPMIALSNRHPSFNLLHGQLIMKGSDTAMSLNPSDDMPGLIKIDDIGEEEEEEEDSAICLSLRQPSFCNLYGNLIPKGSTEALEIGEDDSIVEEAQTPLSQTSSREKSGDPNEIAESLARGNAKWWKDIGYEPSGTMRRACTEFQLESPPKLLEMKNRNVSCVNYYPKIVEIPMECSTLEYSRNCHGLTSRDDRCNLKVEMPEGMCNRRVKRNASAGSYKDIDVDPDIIQMSINNHNPDDDIIPKKEHPAAKCVLNIDKNKEVTRKSVLDHKPKCIAPDVNKKPVLPHLNLGSRLSAKK